MSQSPTCAPPSVAATTATTTASTAARTTQTGPIRLDHVESWIFDLDNTLYPARSNLFGAIDLRMKAYISTQLAVCPDEAFRIQKFYFKKYGTTLRGLMLHHHTAPRDFLDYVHDIDLDVLSPDPDLSNALERLEGKKHVYTNGDGDYARRVLEKLGIDHHFDGIFDIVAADYIPKPDPKSYEKLLHHRKIDPKSSAIFEDLPQNLVPAQALGMTTIWVQNNTIWAQDAESRDHIHHMTDDLAAWIEAIVMARILT